ncbi:MAG TPA: HypC/HybG/HupF family hydrogenase formation chaperone [Thermoplasmata archaeon]|nr:HypC/HybG/HupF family hydrogenase formation chaperone [Thermoplasmata archaeon]
MCLGIPARVVSVRGKEAVLDLRGREVVADASAVSVSPGDYVVTYAGLIVQVLSQEDAEETLALLEQVERAASIVR